MIYKIHNMIHFRSDDGLIWLDDDSSATLTATTCRLLKYLLDHRNSVVYREEILEHVWDAHGLRTSSHSLNKYISDLRAVFRNMGCSEEIIITIPKVGFKISEDISIEIINNAVPAVNSEHHIESDDLSSTEATESRVKKTQTKPVTKKIYWASFTLLVLAFLFLGIKVDLFSDVINAGQDNTYPLGHIGTCQIRSFGPVPNEQKEPMLTIAKELITKKEMPCSGNTVFFFHVSDSVLKGYEGRKFLASCVYSGTKKQNFYSCENYYRPDYEINK